ncbi:MAG: peptidoglycan DD-metalloendopeptidase family protein, partial [Faecalibacterium sp.]|nr:peptidoglycan DD-metalloendopeptidase family protein [Faecalibacterium sp.]
MCKRKSFSALLRAAAMGMACLMLALCLGSAAAPAAYAETEEELRQQLADLEAKLAADRAALEQMKQNTSEAKQRKKNLEAQVSNLKSQIDVITASIAQVQAAVGQKEQDILATQAAIEQKLIEIDQKQAELDAQWGAFKRRMAAMQEMKDSGTMSMLSAVSNLYQFLTFGEAIQDVSRKDTEVMDAMQAQLDALAKAKAELDAEKAVLEEQLAELERQKAELKKREDSLKAKQNDLAKTLVQASNDLLSAEEAQKQAQEQLDSDIMDYNAVMSEIQTLIGSAAGAAGNISFTGFICPLNSYTRVSSEFGYRTLNGQRKLHAGTDFAAPEGTPIYAAAGGYVCAAGWNTGGYGYYVLIYHGTMSDGNTYSTLYAHMVSMPTVVAGTTIAQGTHIGNVGDTGRSFGNHLHLELWRGSSVANSV